MLWKFQRTEQSDAQHNVDSNEDNKTKKEHVKEQAQANRQLLCHSSTDTISIICQQCTMFRGIPETMHFISWCFAPLHINTNVVENGLKFAPNCYLPAQTFSDCLKWRVIPIYRVNTKSSLLWPLLNLGIRADFYVNFYITVKNENIHFITSFCWNISENDKIMLFQPRQLPFLSIQASSKTTQTVPRSPRKTSSP